MAHPETINEIIMLLTNDKLVAWGSSNNYYKLNGRYYEWWHEGTGTKPRQVALCEIPDNVTWRENLEAVVKKQSFIQSQASGYWYILHSNGKIAMDRSYKHYDEMKKELDKLNAGKMRPDFGSPDHCEKCGGLYAIHNGDGSCN